MSTTTKLWAYYFLLEFLPPLDLPMKNLGLPDGVTQMWYMFGSESSI